MNKERILLVISLLALIASGWILYSSFGDSLGLNLPWPSGSAPVVKPVQQAINNIQAFDSQIQRSLNNLSSTGLWQKLLNNEQYLKLSDKAIVPIEIGAYSRNNPFLPLNLPSNSTTTNAQ
ncbi:MAG: hypothetical protein V1846_01475 [Candidatus Komeilibacteria bacterium]